MQGCSMHIRVCNTNTILHDFCRRSIMEFPINKFYIKRKFHQSAPTTNDITAHSTIYINVNNANDCFPKSYNLSLSHNILWNKQIIIIDCDL